MIFISIIGSKRIYASTITLFLLSCNYLKAQDQGCQYFENGTFMAYLEEPSKMSWKVIRQGNFQKEIFAEIPQKKPQEIQYGLVDWIDECSYLFTFDSSKFELSETQIAINETGGILVNLYDFDDNCILFTSYLRSDEEEIILDGKMCFE